MVIQVTSKADLQKKIDEAAGKLIVIDFYATWCGPCKMIAPKIEALATQKTNVVFLKVDVDVAEDVAQEFDISAMPTFVFLKGGEKVESFAGANYDKVVDLIRKHE